MFGKNSTNGYTEILPGIQIKTLVYGESSLMTEFLLTKDSLLPEHTHPHEQTGYLVQGQIKLFVGSASQVINPGDSWCIAADVTHKAEILADSVAIEIFIPCREEYKQYLCAQDVINLD